MYCKVLEDGDLEIELQTVAMKYGFCPLIHRVEKKGGKTHVYMEDRGTSLYELYGDDPKDIPTWIWKQIRDIVETLYDCEGIEYRDITSFNFLEKDGKISIIDFGDAKYTDGKCDWFLREFLDGENTWNPDYK